MMSQELAMIITHFKLCESSNMVPESKDENTNSASVSGCRGGGIHVRDISERANRGLNNTQHPTQTVQQGG